VAKTETIRARVDPALKGRAEAILDRLGITPTAAITMLYRQIVMRRGLPFEVSLRGEDSHE
jgi:DNA-damage-inducible protein J